eukprot:CAMPEP_0171588946 /NCGR_PEP_ID=MMETSP0961-20121227/14493_1 /TAXON_ID=87120 /ORGANISM="Aurantiochytrium limacinum, Strain ATCCMYA-1381" /LENGTH=76 /DNA_ID=CAMNT_0012148025 /DNA_START=197 /DNA_END=427 /DNA_ORIENTATION=-
MAALEDAAGRHAQLALWMKDDMIMAILMMVMSMTMVMNMFGNLRYTEEGFNARVVQSCRQAIGDPALPRTHRLSSE